MITFETANSVYTIRMLPNGTVEILKTAEINPRSQFNQVGVPRYATGFEYRNGVFSFDSAEGYWHTSKVQRFL